jgi:hypothetical protein
MSPVPPRRLALVALLTGLLAGLGLAAAAPAAADELVTWSVAPRPVEAGPRANYGFVVDPGAVVEDAVVVTNLDTEPLVLDLYAADGFTTPEGQLDVLPGGQPSTDLGTWVTLGAAQVSLAPGEAVEVPFTLTVPADAAAGDHSGAVVTSLRTEGGPGGVSVDRRLGVRIHTLVSGDLVAGMTVSDLAVDYAGSLVPFAAGTAVVRFTLTNTGNTRVAADQVVQVRGPFGLATRTLAPTRTPELLAGASVTVEVPVDGVRGLGRLTADVALVPAAVGASGVIAQPVAASAPATVVDWPGAAVVVALLLVIWWWRRRRRPHRRPHRRPAAVAPPGPGTVPAPSRPVPTVEARS